MEIESWIDFSGEAVRSVCLFGKRKTDEWTLILVKQTGRGHMHGPASNEIHEISLLFKNQILFNTTRSYFSSHSGTCDYVT